MKEIYRKFFKKWRDLDADVFSHFSSVTGYNRYGSWGAKEFWWETRAQAPKYDALLTFIEQNPVTWNDGKIIWGNSSSFKADTSTFIGPKEVSTEVFQLYPNPAKGSYTIDTLEPNTQVQIFNNAGFLIDTKTIDTRTQFYTNGMPSGLYIIKVDNSNGTVIKKLIIQ